MKKKNLDPNTQLYPLTPGQQLIFLSETYSLKKEVSNICVSVHFESDIAPDLMLQALYLGFLRNDACKIRMHKDGKETKMYFCEDSPNQVTVLDYSDISDEQLRADMEKWSCVPFPNGRMDVQLYYACLVKKGSGKYALYFNVHHVIMDTYSLFYLTSDIFSIYDALKKGTPMPANRSHTLELYQKDIAKDQSNKEALEKQRDFWKNTVLATEPLFNSVNGKNTQMKDTCPGKRYGRSLRILNLKSKEFNGRIPAELVDAVRAYCEANHFSEQVVYYLGIRSHLSRENNYADDVLIYSTLAKRSTILEKYSGLTRADGIGYRMDMPNSTSFAEACEIMSRRQIEYYRNSDISASYEFSEYILEKFNCKATYGYYQIRATFQPYGVDAPEDLRFSFERHAPGILQMPMSMLIIKNDFSGSLLVNYEYSVSMIDGKSVEALHEHLLHFLKTAIANPEMSLEELMKSEPLRLS